MGKTYQNTWQISWNLEDEKKFSSQGGGESSRKEDQLVSGTSWKTSWCIHVLHSRMSREVPCQEQMKRIRISKTVRKRAALGRLRVTSMLTLFHYLSASPWKDRLLLVLAAVRPLWTPGHHWSLAQEDWSIISWVSSMPLHGVLRWKVMPQGHSQSPHTTSISRANLSPSLSNSTTFHVLWSITCPLLSSPSMASTTHCQLKPTPSRWGDNTEG